MNTMNRPLCLCKGLLASFVGVFSSLAFGADMAMDRLEPFREAVGRFMRSSGQPPRTDKDLERGGIKDLWLVRPSRNTPIGVRFVFCGRGLYPIPDAEGGLEIVAFSTLTVTLVNSVGTRMENMRIFIDSSGIVGAANEGVFLDWLQGRRMGDSGTLDADTDSIKADLKPANDKASPSGDGKSSAKKPQRPGPRNHAQQQPAKKLEIPLDPL